jgi:hypothetical protein
MTDEELAEMFTTIISERDRYTMEKLSKAGIKARLCEMPMVTKLRHFDWLKQPYEGGGEDETD